ncbi:hypothetical protein FACS189496_4700 [Bacilli bacterium]|nr:hypothetical protein FACS189496_4700 [Bacilli bacterium]
MNNGIMPLNNLLDDLNYITLLTNNATAAYDGDKINDISVEKANNGDTFIGFDKKEYSLTNNDVVVKSNGKIICLAGILGENEYGINVNTKSAYIEIANFNYATIRKTAQRLAIQTPSARKNSKEITTYNTMVAAQLLTDKFQASLIGVE